MDDVMKIKCVWEHNGNDTLLYSTDYIGAYTRGKNLEEALQKMPHEIAAYCKWCGEDIAENVEVVITQEKESPLTVCDADSDVLPRNSCNGRQLWRELDASQGTPPLYLA